MVIRCPTLGIFEYGLLGSAVNYYFSKDLLTLVLGLVNGRWRTEFMHVNDVSWSRSSEMCSYYPLVHDCRPVMSYGSLKTELNGHHHVTWHVAM